MAKHFGITARTLEDWMKKAYVPRGIFRTIHLVSEMGSFGIASSPPSS